MFETLSLQFVSFCEFFFGFFLLCLQPHGITVLKPGWTMIVWIDQPIGQAARNLVLTPGNCSELTRFNGRVRCRKHCFSQLPAHVASWHLFLISAAHCNAISRGSPPAVWTRTCRTWRSAVHCVQQGLLCLFKTLLWHLIFQVGQMFALLSLLSCCWFHV